MIKHTPGTWSYWSGYNPHDKIEAQVTAEDGDIVIASYNHLIEEGEANARLMAAAPDLLEALEGLLLAFESAMIDEFSSPRDQWQDSDEWESKGLNAISTIARARGLSQ